MVPVAVDCVSWRLALGSVGIGRNTARENAAESAGLDSVPAGAGVDAVLEASEPHATIVTTMQATLAANRRNDVGGRLSMHGPALQSQSSDMKAHFYEKAEKKWKAFHP